MYKSLESSLTSDWPHLHHPLVEKIGLADFVLRFQLECKKARDGLTEEIMALMIQLGITGDEDD